MKRLFMAVPVSEEVKEKVKPILQRLKETGADLNLVPPENLHFTIKFLGDVEEEKVEGVVQRLDSIKQEKFEINLQEVGVFPSLDRMKVIWVGVSDGENFITLMKEVNSKLNYLRENDHEEVPHLTIARVKSGRNKEKLQQVLEELKNLEFGKMVVDKLVLYESELTPEGPVYRVVEEFNF